MLDIKFIRQNADVIKEQLGHKGVDNAVELVDRVVELDEKRRSALVEVEELKRRRNEISALVGKARKNGENADGLMDESRVIGEQIAAQDEAARSVEAALDAVLLEIPNVYQPGVPIGAGEEGNVLASQWGEPRVFSFEPKPHWEIGEKLGILDFEAAAKISGARFYVLKGAGAKLERALISFMLDVHTGRHGYTEIFPPVLVRSEAMIGVGVLPKFGDEAYKIEDEDLWLIPTAEVPVTNLHREEILDAKSLPIKYAAYSPCFRREAGAAGRDTRGVIRVHQFNKVEMVLFVAPEKSYEALEELRRHAETILELLGLPYRTMEHCTGDLGFKATKAYDPEVWFPSQNMYREISSCSNFEAFQARRSGIRYRPLDEKGRPGKPEFVHTLNGSGLAIGRTFAALLENYQNEDGTVTVPEALRPYFGGDLIIAERTASGAGK